MLKKSLLVLPLILFAGLIAYQTAIVYAADPIDPNDYAAREVEIVTMVNQLPEKKKQLDEKVYTGTMEQIVAERIVDVNDVIMFSVSIDEKVDKLCKDVNVPTSKEEFIKDVVKRHNKRVEAEKKKQQRIHRGDSNDPK